MRPYIVGSACHRIQEHLDRSLCEGAINLPAELVAHAERCPHCSPQVSEVEALFQRLRRLPAGLDLGPVPGVIDLVLARTATEPLPLATGQPNAALGGPLPLPARRQRPTQFRWLMGQVAAVVAALVIAVGGLTYVALMVNHLVSGVSPAEVVERWVAPLQDWTQALFRNTQ